MRGGERISVPKMIFLAKLDITYMKPNEWGEGALIEQIF